MTDQERAMQRAKNPTFHPWRANHGTANQARADKAKHERLAPFHTRVIR